MMQTSHLGAPLHDLAPLPHSPLLSSLTPFQAREKENNKRAAALCERAGEVGFSANEVSGGADASYNGGTDGRTDATDAIPPGKKSRPELYCDTTEVWDEGRKGE